MLNIGLILIFVAILGFYKCFKIVMNFVCWVSVFYVF